MITIRIEWKTLFNQDDELKVSMAFIDCKSPEASYDMEILQKPDITLLNLKLLCSYVNKVGVLNYCISQQTFIIHSL